MSPEQAGLLKRDEELYTSREYLMELKLKGLDRTVRGRETAKGEREKGGKKGCEKGKGKGA